MVEVYAFTYTKAQLDRAPEDERTFFLMLCQLLNDVTFLQKVTLTSLNSRMEGGPTQAVNSLLALTMLRFTAGRLREGYTLIKDQWSPLAPRYPELVDGAAYIKALRKYFDKKDNVVHRLRNDAGFHESPDAIRKAYEEFPADEPLIDYVTERRGNTIYAAADLVRAIAMQHITGQPSVEAMLETTATEIRAVSGLFADFGNEFIPAFWQRYLPELRQLKRGDITVEVPARPLDEVALEFYTSDPKEVPE